uniref:Uncharacterized protein n=1 Tax=Steinernema glaseri TaxID=37863 RepID=A0A1I7Y743_9BILA
MKNPDITEGPLSLIASKAQPSFSADLSTKSDALRQCRGPTSSLSRETFTCAMEQFMLRDSMYLIRKSLLNLKASQSLLTHVALTLDSWEWSQGAISPLRRRCLFWECVANTLFTFAPESPERPTLALHRATSATLLNNTPILDAKDRTAWSETVLMWTVTFKGPSRAYTGSAHIDRQQWAVVFKYTYRTLKAKLEWISTALMYISLTWLSWFNKCPGFSSSGKRRSIT